MLPMHNKLRARSNALSRVPWLLAEILLLGCLCQALATMLGGNHNQENLMPLLLALQQAFDRADLRWGLEGGTLLGAVRGGEIIPHENDLDVTVMRNDYARVLALRDEFQRDYGYTLYSCTDASFSKGISSFISTLTWKPYIGCSPEHAAQDFRCCFPCARLYDERFWFSADIFCDYEVNQTDLAADLRVTHAKPPTTISPTGLYHCNGNHDGIACRARQQVLPFTMGSVHNHTMPIPAKAEEILVQGYGANWRVPLSIGIKKVTRFPLGRLAFLVPLIFVFARNWRVVGAALALLISLAPDTYLGSSSLLRLALIATTVVIDGLVIQDKPSFYAAPQRILNRVPVRSVAWLSAVTSVAFLLVAIGYGPSGPNCANIYFLAVVLPWLYQVVTTMAQEHKALIPMHTEK
eukprot:TRINITY_DN54639_c0_g1_i1.p1 TRINITY_DN54639_c0_g1~~TRINITY_DN54639_c0_g1_i1.p1  ORF type:complete len:408 (-),score=52.06 TRINITY_DN54639_c0_g1_i1:162-1385(-)